MTEAPSSPPSSAAPAVWLQQGRQLEAQGRFAEAVSCHDRALAALQQADSPDHDALGVVWMNRGSALRQLGDPASLAAALAAYDEAIALKRLLPLTNDPVARISLAAALMNRGQLLHRLHGTACTDDALAAYDEAAALLRPLVCGSELARDTSAFSPSSPWPRRNFVGTLLNRANLLLDLARFAEAAATARESLELAARHERTDPVDADLALKGRRALCDALGRLLVVPGADQEALAREASDLVDDALALARHWAAGGERGFQPLAARFLRYGAQLYRLHQPHFLAEFLSENLATITSDPELRDLALDHIGAALAESPGQPFLTVGDPASERRLQTARDLTVLRTRLAG